MRTTHRIDVVLLHHDKVGTHVVNVDGFALVGMMIMSIDAPNHDSLTVHQKRIAFDPHRAKTSDNRGSFDYFICGTN
ncbi:unannotated protein [freshwater metagenome]|uniref:Unannotated protein n=1 Tax=freshwater metagenome TaxID=449393 RepID=A0A6J6I5R3_9ZZZZ